MNRSLKLFALGETHAYAARIAAHLGVALAHHEERVFETWA